jgi:hypothetical protein
MRFFLEMLGGERVVTKNLAQQEQMQMVCPLMRVPSLPRVRTSALNNPPITRTRNALHMRPRVKMQRKQNRTLEFMAAR